MMRRLVSRLRGEVTVRVESPFPERVINLCGARNIAFWDLSWESAGSFTCRLSRTDAAALQRGAEKLECVVTPLDRRGAPFFFRRLRNRPALMVGAVSCATALFLCTFFIWDFRVEGNETVPTETILRALEHYGVGIGSFGLSLDSEDLRNHVLLDVPELSWITVNVSGCRAQVQVRERVAAPEIIDRHPPSNLVARRAGLVLEVNSLGGIKCVVAGMSVEEGQILLSGVEDTGTFGARMTAGLGEVTGRTWHTLTTTVPLTAAQKRYTEEKTGYSLIFGRKRVKFFSNSSISGGEYDKITKRCSLSLLGIPLPVTVEQETWRFYEAQTVTCTAAEAEKDAERVLQQRLEAEVTPYGSVDSTLCSSRIVGDTLEVTLRAECRESIGEMVPIYLDETG